MATKIKICSTIIDPIDFVVKSRTTQQAWTVTASTLFSEATCNCPGYTYRAKCSHIAEVEASRCRWVANNDEEEALDVCPNCGESAVEFTSEPEVVG